MINELATCQNISWSPKCPEQSEVKAQVLVLMDFVHFRRIDEFIIFDFFEIIESKENFLSRNFQFYDLTGLKYLFRMFISKLFIYEITKSFERQQC